MNKKQQQLICIGFPRWEGGNYLKSTVQLMEAMAQDTDVLYVDYPFTWKDVFDGWSGKTTDVPTTAIMNRKQSLQKLDLQKGSSMHLLRLPPFLPANFINSPGIYDRILHYNAQNALKAIRHAMKQLGWGNPTVVNAFNPALGNALAGKLNESRLTYYCYDEISASPWIARHGARHEQVFLAKVDQTIVSSKGLMRTKSPLTANCALVKNGVDLSLFKTNNNRPTDMPTGTCIGYVGSVDNRLDVELIKTIARSYPKCNLVFVGRIVDEQVQTILQGFSNIHLLGARPPQQLGAYLSAFDLGIIPFIKTEQTAAIYPLKINEYLALGKAVVTTNFADMFDFEDIVWVSKNTTEFIEAIEVSLKPSSVETIAKRLEVAAQNTWENRAKQMKTYLFPGEKTPRNFSKNYKL